MFRREEAAVRDWTEETPRLCARRQREILESAAAMVKAGGVLCYSTCTFSPEENEGVVSDFLPGITGNSPCSLPAFPASPPGGPASCRIPSPIWSAPSASGPTVSGARDTFAPSCNIMAEKLLNPRRSRA